MPELLDAYRDYVAEATRRAAAMEAARARLEGIHPCPAVHPSYASDVLPLVCALVAGHAGLHRDRGSIVEWPA